MSGYLHKNDSSLISILTKRNETKNLYLYFHEALQLFCITTS